MSEKPRPSKWTRPAWLAILLVCVVAGIGAWQNWWRTYHLAEVRPGVLYRDGNRGMSQFATAIWKCGARTVVMLIDDTEVTKEPFKSELEFCDATGLKLVRIPVKPGERPSSNDVQKFLHIVEDKQNWPVLVHCAQGVRRTGMMVAAYQMTVMGWDKQKTKAHIMLWGRTPERLDDIRGFIDDYDPAKREVGNQHLVKQDQDED